MSTGPLGSVAVTPNENSETVLSPGQVCVLEAATGTGALGKVYNHTHKMPDATAESWHTGYTAFTWESLGLLLCLLKSHLRDTSHDHTRKQVIPE